MLLLWIVIDVSSLNRIVNDTLPLGMRLTQTLIFSSLGNLIRLSALLLNIFTSIFNKTRLPIGKVTLHYCGTHKPCHCRWANYIYSQNYATTFGFVQNDSWSYSYSNTYLTRALAPLLWLLRWLRWLCLWSRGRRHPNNLLSPVKLSFVLWSAIGCDGWPSS